MLSMALDIFMLWIVDGDGSVLDLSIDIIDGVSCLGSCVGIPVVPK